RPFSERRESLLQTCRIPSRGTTCTTRPVSITRSLKQLVNLRQTITAGERIHNRTTTQISTQITTRLRQPRSLLTSILSSISRQLSLRLSCFQCFLRRIQLILSSLLTSLVSFL